LKDKKKNRLKAVEKKKSIGDLEQICLDSRKQIHMNGGNEIHRQKKEPERKEESLLRKSSVKHELPDVYVVYLGHAG
jgi:hypothetical protein